ncbi:hypothetical protein MPSEU_000943800 [Mayamaea pseudoterrestris]|nr:hypothetical protein MPSEU_000943800 [Mayamaea pseudoterrestris]
MSSPSPLDTAANSSNATQQHRQHQDQQQRQQLQELQDQLASLREQISHEKAGKRKLFHSLVKLADELRMEKQISSALADQAAYGDRNWYDGGLWRSPELLPAVAQNVSQSQPRRTAKTMASIPLSDLFFSLVVVTAFTRVGVAVSIQGTLSLDALLYFAVFYTVWTKEVSYGTRFDTSDLSAQVETLLTCFLVLFASLSVQAPMDSQDGTRIMVMAAAVAGLHALLHLRVVFTVWNSAKARLSSGNNASVNQSNLTPMSGSNTPATPSFSPVEQLQLAKRVRAYAIVNLVMNLLETAVWVIGICYFPQDWNYRWAVFATGVGLAALRVPRAFLANDFHAACSKRSVLFILLLGFLLQSIVVVASEFFAYQTPSITDYCFIGSSCLLLFCIKLLYVDDTDTLAQDHALLVNRWAGAFYNLGMFGLLLSTTILGSGLNLLTHSYLAATAALPGPAKNLVCGGLSTVLLSTLFIKSMHVKRVPIDPRHRCWFVLAYAIQTIVLLAVSLTAAVMCYGKNLGNALEYLMNSDIQLLFALSGVTLFVVIMSWMDEGLELTLYHSVEDARAFRTYPIGFWWCLKTGADMSDGSMDVEAGSSSQLTGVSRLSVLSPLLGESVANMARSELAGYDSFSFRATPQSTRI